MRTSPLSPLPGVLVTGKLSVYTHNTDEGEVKIASGSVPNAGLTVGNLVLMRGARSRNRAMDGDTVVLRVLPRAQVHYISPPTFLFNESSSFLTYVLPVRYMCAVVRADGTQDSV